MDYWAETMQDDAYLISADGWVARTARILETDKKGRQKDKGWTCDLIPKPLIVVRYFAKEQAALDARQAELEAATSSLAELEEEHGGEEAALGSLDKIAKAEVNARLKEIKGNKEDKNEAAVLKRWLDLSESETALKRAVKEQDAALDKLAYDKYPKLTAPEIKTLVVDDKWMTHLSAPDGDTISLTDIARFKNQDHPDDVIRNWLRNRNTVEFPGLWERLNNAAFNPVEFDGIRMQTGLNSFTLTSKQWTEKTGAIGIVSKAGRYGGTYAHKDIAFEFASWVSVEFRLYLIKEFQRLKEDENRRFSLAWNLNRTLSKLNYRIHTDAIKAHLIPPEVTSAQASFTYATEADLLNVALFGQTAKQWRDTHPKLDGNMRDHATIEQLLVLANIEGMNAEFIHMALPQGDRLRRLNKIAIRQMRTLTDREVARRLEAPGKGKK